MTGPVLTDMSKKIEPNPNCYAYDPQKFHHEPSIVTYFPNGRLGNVISAYITLSWIQMDHKLHTYIERGAADVLSQVCWIEMTLLSFFIPISINFSAHISSYQLMENATEKTFDPLTSRNWKHLNYASARSCLSWEVWFSSHKLEIPSRFWLISRILELITYVSFKLTRQKKARFARVRAARGRR